MSKKPAKIQNTKVKDPVHHYTSLVRSLGRILKLPQHVIYTATHYVFKYVKLFDEKDDDVVVSSC